MNVNIINIVLTLLVVTKSATGLNILGIFPYQGKSHFFVFRIFLRELARRGHNVTVISHFPEQAPPANYNDISLAGSIKVAEDDVPFQTSYGTVLWTSFYLVNSGIENCKVMLANKEVQNLIKQKPKFDVIVTEQFNSDCSLGVAYKLNTPIVGTTSHVLMPYHYKRLGIPYNQAFVPFHFLEGGTKPTLYQRLERVIFDIYFRYLFHYGQRTDQNTLAEYFDDIPPLEDLAKEIKFLLLYHNFVFTGSRLFPSNVIEVGGYHVGESKPLTGDLKKFVEEAKHGIIYVNFGSVVKATTIPADKVQIMLEIMKEFPQRFIWKWEDDTLEVNKDKLYKSRWLPQVDILGHPKTLAFISHAGNGGATEAIHFAVPTVAMPVLGDQPANAAAVEESGLGVVLQIRDLTKENLRNALNKVLKPEFRERVKQVSRAWHDRPMSPLDTAIFWTEFAARHPNFTFRTAAADVPFYQYHSIDVIAVFSAVLAVIFILIRIIIRICCGSKSPAKVDRKKSKRA